MNVTIPEGASDSRTSRGNITVRTAEEARKAVRKKKELGCDQIKLNEFLEFDLVKVVAEEAHSLGMGVTTHSVDAIQSSNAGVDAIEHIWSIGNTTILYPPARLQLHNDRLQGLIDQEIVCALLPDRELPAHHRCDGEEPDGLDADPRQDRAPAVVLCRAFPQEGKRDPGQSEERIAGVGARHDRQRLQQAVQALHAARSWTAPSSGWKNPTNSSAALWRPAVV